MFIKFRSLSVSCVILPQLERIWKGHQWCPVLCDKFFFNKLGIAKQFQNCSSSNISAGHPVITKSIGCFHWPPVTWMTVLFSVSDRSVRVKNTPKPKSPVGFMQDNYIFTKDFYNVQDREDPICVLPMWSFPSWREFKSGPVSNSWSVLLTVVMLEKENTQKLGGGAFCWQPNLALLAMSQSENGPQSFCTQTLRVKRLVVVGYCKYPWEQQVHMFLQQHNTRCICAGEETSDAQEKWLALLVTFHSNNLLQCFQETFWMWLNVALNGLHWH